MSADAWSACPRCAKIGNSGKEKAMEEAAALYGKVSQEEFLKAAKKAAATKMPDEDDDEIDSGSLAAYYEIWISKKGTFEVNFSAHCEKCGFKFDYRYKEQVAI